MNNYLSLFPRQDKTVLLQLVINERPEFVDNTLVVDNEELFLLDEVVCVDSVQFNDDAF
jgi:hypothetical protein